MNSFTKRGSWSVVLSLLLMASAILSGCSGGGDDGGTKTTTTGTGSALQLAEKISVVDAKSTTGAAPLRIGTFKVAPSTVTAAGTDWTNDVTQVYVHERSAESFDTVNEIMCMMAQSKYDKMVNKGTYKAQIDNNLCKSNKDSASSAGQSSQDQSSGSTAPNYETWILDSKRADSNTGTPQYVKVWVHEKAEQDMPARVIYVNVTITAGVDTKPPYGLFSLYFKGYPEGAVSGTPLFKGVLKAVEENGKVVLKFAEDDGIHGSKQAALDKATDGSGKGSASSTDNWNGTPITKSFDFAYDSNYFLRTEGTTPVCLDRNNFNKTAWSYGLYDVNGKRVSRNSGFPIKYNDGTKDYFGWAGYWGLWLPETVALADGAAVKKQDYSNSGVTEAAYTLVKKGGKLKKHTRHTATLDLVKNIPLDGWMEQDPANPTGPYINYRVRWDGANFIKFQQLNQTTYMWTDITPAAISVTGLNFGELNFWSQSLNGQVRVPLTCTWNNTTFKNDCTAPTNATSAIYFAEDIIYPGDTVPTALKCYDNCPKYDATLGVTTYTSDFSPTATGHNYSFDATASGMLLKEGTNPLLLTAVSTTGPNQYGFMSGPLFDPTSTNLALLACDDWNHNGLPDDGTCGWKAWSALNVFYTWETGPNQWNQFTALRDANGVVRFEAPLQVQYTYPATTGVNPSDVDTKYNGTKFYLEYSGFGQLNGIPGKCVDDSGLTVQCSQNTRWIPEFIIPTGGEATYTNGTVSTFYIKPLQVEESMKPATAACTLTTTPYTLPTMATDFVDFTPDADPADATLISTAPAVIGGIVQTGF